MKLNWGHGILIFIAFFVLLATVFMVFALRQHVDLVDVDYYDKGANFSKQVETDKRSYAFRDSVTFQAGNDSVQIGFCNSIAMIDDTVTIYFYRPSNKKRDYTCRSKLSNMVQVPYAKLIKGRYVVTLSWYNKNEKYAITREIYIK